MSAVKLAFTDQGMIVGDFEEVEGGWSVHNPTVVQMGQQQVGLIPLLGLVQEKDIKLLTSEVHFGQLFEPVEGLRNHWNGQFGTGIQLATSSSVITKN